MIIGDATTGILQSALRGLAERQRVTADNIANVQTPNFLAGRTDFESSLKAAIAAGGDASAVMPTVERNTTEPTNTNGNNVSLDTETVIATETGLRYQLALRALDSEYSTMRTACRG
ncbi:flagellar basal body rod protein FlgB [Tessaracoccus sp.]